ncbi:hypothetical protein MSG28_010773 [Choristoneura fumiferana]|uniref:Uncharacterized protein n=1 Tax=Choristoneura fumiferana TaxID=7141 RepID=A0ACC0KNY8_CHOFU|nr:hypothetical protein MSG28_010773 [Choristoneura fumiferana]
MGGIQYPHLNGITREIWQFCEARNIFLFASYINTKENIEADFQSRKHTIEWELSDDAFQSIIVEFGEPDIDLFASRTNSKCKSFISWKKDPDAIAVDAFTVKWSEYFFYAFPPFNLRSSSIIPDSYPGCRSALSEALKRRGVPHSSMNIMLSSLAPSTIKQYNTGLQLWWKFCSTHNIVPYEVHFNSGASYGTLNSFRSALSLLMGPKIGMDDRIKRFFKGVFRTRPMRPKYSTTWDPGTTKVNRGRRHTDVQRRFPLLFQLKLFDNYTPLLHTQLPITMHVPCVAEIPEIELHFSRDQLSQPPSQLASTWSGDALAFFCHLLILYSLSI